jgi:hypothetical protein
MLELGWDLNDKGRARLLMLLAMLEARELDTGAVEEIRFGGTALRRITDSTRIVFLLDQTKTHQHLKPVVTFLANEIQKHAQGVFMGAIAHGPVKKIQDLTADLGAFQEVISKHAFVNGKEASVGKSLKKVSELFKQEAKQAAEADLDCPRILLNFMSSEPDNLKDVTKAMKSLDAQGIVVVTVALNPSLSEDALQECSSPGLVFRVADSAAVLKFLEKSFTSMETIQEQSSSLTPEETLQRLVASKILA